MASHSHVDLEVKAFQPSQQLKTLMVSSIAIGVLGLLIGIIRDPARVWPAYLTAFFFVSTLALGGLFFATINHVAKAGWSTGIRRIAEGMSSFVPVMLLGSLLLLVGLKHLYPWARPEEVAASTLIQAKTAYLNTGFLIARILVFGLGVMWFAKVLVGNSLKQDSSGDENLTKANVAWGIGYILFFAIAFSLFTVDLLMSLLPTWYSTIFGIYVFAGMFQASMAFLILLLYFVKNAGLVKGYFGVDHIHDVAKYMKGMTVFWAYIAFSQFMLIWYANIPEETEFYIMRIQNGWLSVSMGLLIFRFVVPFLALLPRWAKRTESHLKAVCVLILVMHYVDFYWLVYPNFNQNKVVFGFYEIALLVGFMGLFLFTLTRFFSKNSLVAVKDPRIQESLSHHVTY